MRPFQFSAAIASASPTVTALRAFTKARKSCASSAPRKSITGEALAAHVPPDEEAEWHARDARRDRDEGADDREHPRKEDGRLAVSGEPTVRDLEIVRADEDVAPVPLDERTTAVCSDRVAGERAERVSGHARGNSAPVRPR